MAEYTAPGYEGYARFLCEELKPWVDASYRTLSGPGDSSVMGSSLGGVVSLHLAWSRPDVFGAAACLSSTFGWRDDLFDRVRSEPRRDIRIYLDSGWPGDNYEVTRAMRGALAGRGYREGSDLLYFAFPEARHDERHWAMRAHLPMQFFHGRPAARRAQGVP
jgi:predicted alpha/beta superfamily hydrolase